MELEKTIQEVIEGEITEKIKELDNLTKEYDAWENELNKREETVKVIERKIVGSWNCSATEAVARVEEILSKAKLDRKTSEKQDNTLSNFDLVNDFPANLDLLEKVCEKLKDEMRKKFSTEI